MPEPRKITIIEGPPPTFELVHDAWLLGLTEGPFPTRIALCRVRSINGPALVERCYRAWRDSQPISLEFQTEDGETREATIVAARWVEKPEGDMLYLWVCLSEDELEIEIGFDIDDFDDIGDDIDGFDFDLPI
ncbi:MAG TPA: hypothetical protein G4O11_03050 [Anaerolineae bacterium]|nr:hypothetical protein [Anaerolineae bacterium]